MYKRQIMIGKVALQKVKRLEVLYCVTLSDILAVRWRGEATLTMFGAILYVLSL